MVDQVGHGCLDRYVERHREIVLGVDVDVDSLIGRSSRDRVRGRLSLHSCIVFPFAPRSIGNNDSDRSVIEGSRRAGVAGHQTYVEVRIDVRDP